MVEFSGTFDIVKPVALDRGNRRLLYEFSNRGGRAAISAFNYGKGRDFTNPESAGDGFLMRLGYAVMWSGWQGDLIDRDTNVVAYLPEARQNGQRLRGNAQPSDAVTVAIAHCYFAAARSATARMPELIDAIRGYQQAGRPEGYAALSSGERTLNDPSCNGYFFTQTALFSPMLSEDFRSAASQGHRAICGSGSV